MNNKTIANILSEWFPSDFYSVCKIQDFDVDKCGIHIVNTGNHWIAIYVTKDTVEFFDSFGRKPLYMKCKFDFKEKRVIVYSKRLQDNQSLVCGLYCLGFVYFRLKLNDLQSFFVIFNNDRIRNDVIIINVVHKLLL